MRGRDAGFELAEPLCLLGALLPDLRQRGAAGNAYEAPVLAALKGDPLTAADRVQPVLDAVAAVRRAHPGLRIDQFGDGSANKWFNETILKDFKRAEWTAVPLAMGILLVAPAMPWDPVCAMPKCISEPASRKRG